MDVKDILDIKTIKTNLQAKSKADVLQQLTQLLKDAGYVENEDVFIKDIYAREAEGITGIGNYIAIPHGRSAAVSKIGVAIGIAADEIAWETLDDKGVKGIILFAVGNDTAGADTHLKLLSMFARKLGDDDVVYAMLNAKQASDVVEAFV